MNKFVAPNDSILIKIAESISDKNVLSEETKGYIERMLKVAYGEQKDHLKPLLVGLAAPQIGISKRIILVDIAANGKGGVGGLKIFINPEIIWISNEENEWYEGCFSTDKVCGIVSRPTKIKIKAVEVQTLPVWKAREIAEEFGGYTARIFQHEIDHLNGKEFITHITDDNNLHWVEPEEFPLYRDNERWRNWLKKCSRQRWNQIKG